MIVRFASLAARLRLSRLCLPALMALLLAVCVGARADLTVAFDLKNGDKISDVTRVVARVESTADIERVEFSIDGMLKTKSVSVPYRYEWDTIADTEGMHTVSVTAYDVSGQMKTATLSLVIDNELGQGAPALARLAQKALAAHDLDTALKFSRRASKADAANIIGPRVQANVYADQQEWDKAIDTLTNAKSLNDSSDALRELASYRMRRALLIGNEPKFATEVQAISDLRRKAGSLDAKTAQATNPKSYDAIGDALIAAGRYHDAVDEYAGAGTDETTPPATLVRLALAYTLDNRPTDAIKLLAPMFKAKHDDSPMRAAQGLALLRLRRFVEARAVAQRDLRERVPAALIVAAYADVVLGKTNQAEAEAQDALTLLPNAGEAYYALSMALRDYNDSEAALHTALSLSPLQTGPILDYATRYALLKRADRFEQANALTDFVLQSDPENTNAQMIQALTALAAGKTAEGETTLKALVKREPTAPDVLMALAVYWNSKGSDTNTGKYLAEARKADPLLFDLSSPGNPLEYLTTLNRKLHYRAGFYLTPATLLALPPAP